VQIVGPCYIGSNVHIEPGVSVIGPTWIGRGSHLRAGSRVERSVLFDYTRVGESQTVEEKILSFQYCVDRSGHATYVGDDTFDLRWGDARG
jgi:mannose-1-phosphate guanylyltransferase